jgi:hypothetical protein
LNISIIFLLTALLFNIPFGFLRGRERKFSWQWFLWIHISVPFTIAARICWHIDIAFIPAIILAALLGQYLGGAIAVRK